MNSITRKVSVAPKVFERFPSFRRGIVIASELRNHPENEELERLLAETVSRARRSPVDLAEDARLKAWNEAYKELGVKPNKHPPAHRSLLKRAQRPDAVIPFINSVVAVMNICSLEGAVPVGGDDIAPTTGDLVLRPAMGTEEFVPLGAPDFLETPPAGELIYVDDGTMTVMCRRWNWRNSHMTRITENTQTLVMNIDGLGDGATELTVQVRDRVAKLLATYCQASVRTEILTPATPSASPLA
ncbi:MAG: B3/4 domain-containing protein [Spirochaetaceae bacterium]